MRHRLVQGTGYSRAVFKDVFSLEGAEAANSIPL